MSFGLRGGGFGSGTLNPFGSNTGGFGQYNIAGDSANEEAALDKYAATVAWQQGRLDDDSYIAALEKFKDSTAKDSRERIAADDDLQDARYTISRNEVVNKLNNATGTARRISLWQDLIAVDRKRLRTMTAGDNEQRRELLTRIDDQEGNIRKESWSEMVRRYNSRRGVPIDAMLRAARRLASRSAGSKDHREWLDQVDQWTETKDNDTLQKLQQEWQKNPNTGGNAVLRFLDERLATAAKGTPKYDQLLQQRTQVAETIATTKRTNADADMEQAGKMGTVSDEAYLQYWVKRLKEAKPGSDDRRSVKEKVYNETIRISVKSGQKEWQETGDPTRLLGVYNAALSGMTKGTSAWTDTYQTILKIQADAYGTLGLLRADPTKGRGTIDTSGGWGSPPGGPGTGANGFASQYDGSDFANQNCGYTAAAMLAWAAGKTGLSGGDMRWYAGDPSGASFLSGMATAMDRVGLGLEVNNGYALNNFRRRVANGEAAIVNGLYANLGPPYRLSGFEGAHSVTVTQAKKVDGKWWYYVMDPIGRSAKEGAQWWPEQVMANFAWSGATNPISGNKLSGVVSFANRNGSVFRNKNGGSTPFQAFDTDAKGNSTIGKGGGNSRAEAGYMPPDFAKRARGGKQGSSVDDIAVWTFLGAVSKLARPGEMPENEQEEKQWVNRAKRLLERHDGDVRLAGADWFTGGQTSTTQGDWSKTEVYYANAIGGQFKLAPIEVGAPSAGSNTEAPPEIAAELAEGLDTPGPVDAKSPEVADNELATRQSEVNKKPGDPESLNSYSPQSIDIAKRALKAAGIVYSDGNVRVILTMLETLNGGEEINPLNPFNLTTDDAGRFEGQTGIGPNGEPQFGAAGDPVQAAIEAWAEILPDDVIAAGNSNDPRRFMDSVGKSGMSPVFAENNLQRTWNANPGNEMQQVYGVPSGIDVPSSLADLARQHPDLESLFNIDVTDPIQVAWYKENIDNMREAAAADSDKWTFIRPDRVSVPLDFAPYLLVEAAGNTFVLSRQLADYHIARDEHQLAEEAIREGIAGLNPGDLTVEGIKDVSDAMHQMRDEALFLPGGAARARRIMQDLQIIMAQTLGSTENVSVTNANGQPGQEQRWVADPNLTTNPMLLGEPELLAVFADINEQMSQDPLLLLSLPKDGINGFDENGNINPDRGFTTWVTDDKGVMQPKIVNDVQDPKLFSKVDRVEADGSKTPVPYYSKLGGYIQTIVGGQEVWQKVDAAGLPVTIYSNQPISGARAATQDTNNLGPEEQGYRGQTTAGMSITVPDPTDPDRRRSITYWTLGPNTDGSMTWLGLPRGQNPSIIYTGTGRMTDAPDGSGFLVDGKKVDMATMAGDFTAYGVGGTVKGVPGIGGPGMRVIVRTTAPGMDLDTSLTTLDRWDMGGDYWPVGTPPPTAALYNRSRTELGLDDRVTPMSFGGTREPVGPSSGWTVDQVMDQRRTDLGIEDPLSANPPDWQQPDNAPAGQPHGSPRISDLGAFVRNFANPTQLAVAREAQQARVVASTRAAVQRAEQLAAEGRARQARIRQNATIAAMPQNRRPLTNAEIQWGIANPGKSRNQYEAETANRPSAYVPRKPAARPVLTPGNVGQQAQQPKPVATVTPRGPRAV